MQSVSALAVLPDGRVVSGSYDRTLRVWEVDSGASRALERIPDGWRGKDSELKVLPVESDGGCDAAVLLRRSSGACFAGL